MKLFFATEPVPLKSVIVFPHGKKTKKNPKQWMIYGLLRSSDCTERCHGIPAAANARSCSALRSPRWHPPDGGGCSCDLRGQSFWNPTVQTTTSTLVPSRRGPARSPGNSLLQNKKKKTKKKGLGTKRTRLTMNNEIFIVFLSSKTFRESAGRFWSLWFLNGVETGAINGYRGG